MSFLGQNSFALDRFQVEYGDGTVSRVMSFDEVLSDPQHQARRVWQSPDDCDLKLPRVPFDFGDPASDGPPASVQLAEQTPW